MQRVAVEWLTQFLWKHGRKSFLRTSHKRFAGEQKPGRLIFAIWASGYCDDGHRCFQKIGRSYG
jgi:hypothetical protein